MLKVLLKEWSSYAFPLTIAFLIALVSVELLGVGHPLSYLLLMLVFWPLIIVMQSSVPFLEQFLRNEPMWLSILICWFVIVFFLNIIFGLWKLKKQKEQRKFRKRRCISFVLLVVFALYISGYFLADRMGLIKLRAMKVGQGRHSKLILSLEVKGPGVLYIFRPLARMVWLYDRDHRKIPLYVETVDQEVAVRPKAGPVQFKLMTWNIWGRLNQDPRYTIAGKTARQRMIEVIRKSKADIITMTEAYGSAADIAKALGYHYYTHSPRDNLAIFSRYPLENAGTIKGLSPFSFIAATVMLPEGGKIRVYNIWLTSKGRHIVEIRDKKVGDEQFAAGDDIRYKHLLQLLEHPAFRKDIADSNKVPVIVAGDFNCVSHLDYTEKTKALGLNYSRVLPIRVSMAMLEAGFTDTYRFVHPDITKNTLGHTWTTVGPGFTYRQGKGFVPVAEGKNPQPEHRGLFARIDYIYCTGKGLKAVQSHTITHHFSNASRSFPEFPSDHAAVLTIFELQQSNVKSAISEQ